MTDKLTDAEALAERIADFVNHYPPDAWLDTDEAVKVIVPVLERYHALGRLQGLEEAAKWFESDAELCDCFAHSASECACGAWDDRKTYDADRIPAAIRAQAGKDRP